MTSSFTQHSGIFYAIVLSLFAQYPPLCGHSPLALFHSSESQNSWAIVWVLLVQSLRDTSKCYLCRLWGKSRKAWWREMPSTSVHSWSRQTGSMTLEAMTLLPPYHGLHRLPKIASSSLEPSIMDTSWKKKNENKVCYVYIFRINSLELLGQRHVICSFHAENCTNLYLHQQRMRKSASCPVPL